MTKTLGVKPVSVDQLNLMLEFISSYDLPPYLPSCSLKDFLWLVINGKFYEVLAYANSQINPKQTDLISPLDNKALPFLQPRYDLNAG